MYKKPPRERNMDAIHSAALQDHLLRKANIDVKSILQQPPRFRVRVSTNLPKPVSKTASVIAQYNQRSSSTAAKAIQKLEVKQKQSILPYQSEQLKKMRQKESDAIKMEAYKKKLTLAQRLGIVGAPPLPLTQNQWQIIEQQSRQRGDSESICSICLQDFRTSPQTLLSCSHTFHAACLASFERHNKVKSCPVCRRQDYDKKTIDEGIRIYTFKCIVRIQAALRGSHSRIVLYQSLINRGFKAHSKLFGRRLIGYKMWRLSARLSERAKQNRVLYEAMLKKNELQFKGDHERLFQDLVELQHIKMRNAEELRQYLVHKDEVQGQVESQQQKDIKKLKAQEKWQWAKNEAIKRSENTCSICLLDLGKKDLYLLSCSHVFHVNCINSFERYSVPNDLCPCCRTQYQKQLYKFS